MWATHWLWPAHEVLCWVQNCSGLYRKQWGSNQRQDTHKPLYFQVRWNNCSWLWVLSWRQVEARMGKWCSWCTSQKKMVCYSAVMLYTIYVLFYILLTFLQLILPPSTECYSNDIHFVLFLFSVSMVAGGIKHKIFWVLNLHADHSTTTVSIIILTNCFLNSLWFCSVVSLLLIKAFNSRASKLIMNTK